MSFLLQPVNKYTISYKFRHMIFLVQIDFIMEIMYNNKKDGDWNNACHFPALFQEP